MKRPANLRGVVRVLGLFALALLPGCLGGDYGPHFGVLDIAESHATATYSVTEGTARVDVSARLHGNDTGRITSKAFIIGSPCGIGPRGEPDGWLATREASSQQIDHTPADRSITIQLSAAVPAGSRYAVVLTTKGENTIGPIFGTCQDLVAAA